MQYYVFQIITCLHNVLIDYMEVMTMCKRYVVKETFSQTKCLKMKLLYVRDKYKMGCKLIKLIFLM